MTRYIVTVYVNVDEEYSFCALAADDKIACVGEFAIEAPDLMGAANAMWVIGNKMEEDLDNKPYPHDVRSLSVGDLIKVAYEGGMTFFAVERVGFAEIPEPTNPIVALEGTAATSRKAVRS